MAYEIPQQLQHKERILFGLTFQQLGWAALFGSIVLIILTRKGNLTTNIIIALFPALLGVLFVFFDINKWLKYFFHFFRFRQASLMSEKMKSLVGIKKIENSIVYGASEVAILQVTPINFCIKTDEEQNGIIVGFQKFLNSLDFPVQIVMTTNNLNIESYLSGLEKRVKDKSLFNDFASFMRESIAENQMRTRLFFLVIPKKIGLDIQCKICKERLESLGLKAVRLNDSQLVNNLRLFFNDVDQEREAQKNIDNGLHYLIAPNKVRDLVSSIQINDKFCSVVAASGYPRMVESGFLDKIISTNDDFDISIHIEPFSIETMMVMLNKELQKQRADLYAEELKKSINPSLEIKYSDTRKVLEALQKGNEKLFNVSLYINCKAKSREELALLVKKVESELNSLMIVPETPLFRQVSAYKAMIPTGRDELRIKRNITTSALSAFFPFTSPFLTVEPNGVMLGLNKNKVPFIKDIFGLSNANGLILATSGAGKSYFTKLLIARQLLNGAKVMVIDPQAEYLGLVEQCKGQLITISRTSETIINPLDLMGHEFIEKRLALMDLFKIMFGELSEIQKSIIDKAVNETYARKGITADSYKDRKPPVLGDLYKVLMEMDKKASQMEKVTYRALINRLYMYTEGVFSFLSTQSNINFDNDFVCFNIGDMPKQVKPVIMFLILDYVYMKMKETKERKLLVVDEAWSLLGQAEEASYIFEIVKTCRKFNLGLLLITQDVADLVNSKAGHAVLANSSYSLLLRQKPAVIDGVVKMFNLSNMEKEYLLTATQGRGILIMDNDHQELEVVASPKEHKLITTNPDEILRNNKERKKQPEEKQETNINLDLEKGLFYGKELSLDQKNYLNNHGYETGFFVLIGKTKPEEYWVKANKVESLSHTFLVQNIKNEIIKHTKNVTINLTEAPDIIFKNKKGKQVALEIETGEGFKKHKQRIETKFNNAIKKYGKNIHIILTSKDFRTRYQNRFPKIKILVRTQIREFLTSQFKK
jgi:type IV secretory pathway VirB4 component